MEENLDQQSDEVIVRRVQQGQVEAFDVLVDRYEKKLSRYVGRIVRTPEDVFDIVQQAFLKAYINMKSFDVSRKFSSWMYRIAHNEMVNVLKKNQRRFSFPLIDFDIVVPYFREPASDNPQNQAERNEMRTTLEKSITQLPEKYREPIVLYYMEDFSYQEIADIMRIPIATVGVRINRAKGLLQHILEQSSYGKSR